MGDFWKGKRILITGHSGFKGTWLSLLLNMLGAEVTGYSLPTIPDHSLFKVLPMEGIVNSYFGDIRDFDNLNQVVQTVSPEIIFHLAAQPLVRESYINPLETFSTNVMGTANILQTVRESNSVRVVVNVTTDKCYANKEWPWSYRENDQLGGYDPYSNSKACSELITSSFRDSFLVEKGIGIATARAGNVIGGGDWSKDRLIPDCIQALVNDKPITLRSPNAVRPWQHVLEPLYGYLLLVEKLYENYSEYSEAWNFGPNESDMKSVEWIVKKLIRMWESGEYMISSENQPHETQILKLDISKSRHYLGFEPVWNLEYSLGKIIEWTRAFYQEKDMLEVCTNQIKEYISKVKLRELEHETNA